MEEHHNNRFYHVVPVLTRGVRKRAHVFPKDFRRVARVALGPATDSGAALVRSGSAMEAPEDPAVEDAVGQHGLREREELLGEHEVAAAGGGAMEAEDNDEAERDPSRRRQRLRRDTSTPDSEGDSTDMPENAAAEEALLRLGGTSLAAVA